MADPINWGALSPVNAAQGAQALMPHVISQITNPNGMQAAPGSAADLAYQAQMAQTSQAKMGAIMSYMAGQQQRAIDQQNANTTQFTAQSNVANQAIVNQRENAVAGANIDKTNAETSGTNIDVANKAREEQKQLILLQAAQTGGLPGYMNALQSLDPDKYLDVTKKQQDIATGILGQKKSILDLQGTQRDQAVKSFGDMNKLLYSVETSPNPEGTYKQLVPTLQEINGDAPDTYDPNWVTAHFVAGLGAVGAGGKDGGGINPALISQLPGNVQGATAFAGGAPAPVQARAAKIAAQAPQGVQSANSLVGQVDAHDGVPVAGLAAASDITGLSDLTKIISETGRNWAANLNQYKSSLIQAGIDVDKAEGYGYLPAVGDSAAEAKAKLNKGISLLNSIGTEVNPRGLGNPTASPQQTGTFTTQELMGAAQLAVQQGHFADINSAMTALTQRANQ